MKANTQRKNKMSKTTLPKEIKKKLWETKHYFSTECNERLYNHTDMTELLATAVAQAEERVKQQVLELIGEFLVDGSFIPLDRNSLRQQLIEKVSSL